MKRKVLLGLLISAVCLYLSLRGVDWHAVWAALRRANYFYIVPNGALIILSMWLRAVRWRYMTDAVKPGIRHGSLFASTMIGFMVNNVLPLRLGEIARPFSLSHKEDISRSAAFATIVVERVFDALSLLLVSALLLFMAPMLIEGEARLVQAAYIALALHAVALCSLVLLKVKTEATIRFLRRLLSLFPDRVGERLEGLLRNFTVGLGILQNAKSLLAVSLWSLAVWAIVGFSNYFIFLAFDLNVPWYAPYVVLVIVSLGVMLPSAPGYVGTFQYFTVAALKIFGIPASVGLSFSLVLHAGNYVPVTLLGLYYLRREHFTLRQLEQEATGPSWAPFLPNGGMLHTVIMAGGRGERFWPLSRGHKPKQLLPLYSDKPMLVETIDRVSDLVPLERTYVVAGEALATAIAGAVPGLAKDRILSEPTGRNTAMAIGLAAAEIGARDPDAVMLVLSADHRIEPASRLREILAFGAELAASEDRLVTIGITPTRAESGYGYIEIGDVVARRGDLMATHVAGFKEKPEPRLAQVYYYGKKHLWNAGIFVWSVRSIWRALEAHCPVHFKALTACRNQPGNEACRAAAYQQVPDISIDFAVLEKASNVITIKADLVWDDVGSWLALDRLRERDQEGNVLVGEALCLDTAETIVFNEAPGVVATLGVSDLVVVRSGPITFVAHKSRLGQIRSLVQRATLEHPELV